MAENLDELWDSAKPIENLDELWDSAAPTKTVVPSASPALKNRGRTGTRPSDGLTPEMDAVAGGLSEGVTMGFADELKGGAGALLDVVLGDQKLADFPENYSSLRDSYRQEQETFQRESPIAYGAGNLAGIIPSIVASAPLGIIKGGAAVGGMLGAGGAEEMKDVPIEGLKGAGMTVAGGALGVGFGKLVEKGAKLLAEGMKKTGKSLQDFEEKIGGALTDDVIRAVRKDNPKLIDVEDDVVLNQLSKEKMDEYYKNAIPNVAKTYGITGKNVKNASLLDLAVTGGGYASMGIPGAIIAPVVKKGVEKSIVGRVAKQFGSGKKQADVDVVADKLARGGSKLRRWSEKLDQAKQRGGHALGSTIYLLQQTDPDFREAWRNIDEEDKSRHGRNRR